MRAQDILKKARTIELRTKKILKNFLIGDYQTKNRGFGLEFDQLNDYYIGCDVRFIDWKSSARTNKLLIKEYCQESTRTVMIVLDISASNIFGSTQARQEWMIEIASILASAAAFMKDLVGIVVVSDHIELYIPPSKGIAHAYRIMEQLLTLQPKSKGTLLKKGFEYVSHVQKNECLLFIISDFIDVTLDPSIGILSKRNDIVAVRCLADTECSLPSFGLMHCIDLETNQEAVISTHKKYVHNFLSNRIIEQNTVFKKYQIDCIDVASVDAFLEKIVPFLRKRALTAYYGRL